MTILTKNTDFAGPEILDKNLINFSQPSFQFEFDVIHGVSSVFISAVNFLGYDSKPNSTAVIPVGVSGSKTIVKQYYPEVDFSPSFPLAEQLISQIEEIDIEVNDTQNYVVVPVTNKAIIPYWS